MFRISQVKLSFVIPTYFEEVFNEDIFGTFERSLAEIPCITLNSLIGEDC